MVITSANTDRFPKFFHCQISEKILYMHIINIIYLTLSRPMFSIIIVIIIIITKFV